MSLLRCSPSLLIISRNKQLQTHLIRTVCTKWKGKNKTNFDVNRKNPERINSDGRVYLEAHTFVSIIFKSMEYLWNLVDWVRQMAHKFAQIDYFKALKFNRILIHDCMTQLAPTMSSDSSHSSYGIVSFCTR